MAAAGGWRPDPVLPEVAFAGRSNVGKSSLLNRLVGRRKLARVSRTPGRTQEINFFRLNDAIVLADLPGYGFARVGKDRRRTWRALIEGYLGGSPALRGVVLLVDARHDPSPDDLAMREYLGELGVPVLIALTKWDKLNATARRAQLAALATALDVSEDQVVPTSAETGHGRDELAEALVALIEGPAWQRPPRDDQ